MKNSESLNPWLDEVLERTLGIPLFQEQLLRMAMVVANFTGGEAEELRRAMGFKRPEKRMQDVEVKLRRGITANKIDQGTQARIIQSITSCTVWLPGIPRGEFCADCLRKCLPEISLLGGFHNLHLEQPADEFYSPATLIKDAQRHGQRFLPDRRDLLRQEMHH